MKNYVLTCDKCGQVVDNLFTVNFKATDESESGDFYIPDFEICEDCVDEICNIINELYNRDCTGDCDNCEVPDLEDCEELEVGENPYNIKMSIPLTQNELNETLQNLRNLTDDFIEKTNEISETITSKQDTNDIVKLNIREKIEKGIADSDIHLNLSEDKKNEIFDAIYGFSDDQYENYFERKINLIKYLDSLDGEDEKLFAMICGAMMTMEDQLTTGLMPFLKLAGLAGLAY